MKTAGKVTITSTSSMAVGLLLMPVVTTLTLGAAILLGAYFGYNNIKNLSEERDSLAEQEAVLTSKYDALAKVRDENIDPTNKMAIVLPDSNSSTHLIAQMKRISGELSLTITETSVSSSTAMKSGVMKTSIEVVAETDDIRNINDFVQRLTNSAPITAVESVEVTKKMSLLSADMKINTFWSEYPTNLPPIDKPVGELSQDDLSLMARLSALEIPPFTTLNPSESSNRQNPFE